VALKHELVEPKIRTQGVLRRMFVALTTQQQHQLVAPRGQLLSQPPSLEKSLLAYVTVSRGIAAFSLSHGHDSYDCLGGHHARSRYCPRFDRQLLQREQIPLIGPAQLARRCQKKSWQAQDDLSGMKHYCMVEVSDHGFIYLLGHRYRLLLAGRCIRG
jgi:hypothetical protein